MSLSLKTALDIFQERLYEGTISAGNLLLKYGNSNLTAIKKNPKTIIIRGTIDLDILNPLELRLSKPTRLNIPTIAIVQRTHQFKTIKINTAKAKTICAR